MQNLKTNWMWNPSLELDIHIYISISTNLNDYAISCVNGTTFNTTKSATYHYTWSYVISQIFFFRTYISVSQFDIPHPLSQSSWWPSLRQFPFRILHNFLGFSRLPTHVVHHNVRLGCLRNTGWALLFIKFFLVPFSATLPIFYLKILVTILMQDSCSTCGSRSARDFHKCGEWLIHIKISGVMVDKTTFPWLDPWKLVSVETAVVRLLIYVTGPGRERAHSHCSTGTSWDGNADSPARKPLSGRKS